MYILIKIAQSYTLYLSKPYLCTDFCINELKNMNKTLILVLFAALMTACGGNKQQFTVEGQVEGANGKTLYFEQSALNGILLADSVKLGSGGSFKFRHAAPEAPDFYRLRIEDKIINFCVDSTETIKVQADFAKFATDYTIADSENNLKIKELSLKLAELQNKVNLLAASYNANKISNVLYNDSLNRMVKAYKEEIKAKYIYSAPNTPYAYHALFQRVGQYALFDPLNDKDERQNDFRRQQQRSYIFFLGRVLNPSDQDKGGINTTAQRSDAVLYAEQHLDQVEDYLKRQQTTGINARHYQNLLLQIKKIREKYESGK